METMQFYFTCHQRIEMYRLPKDIRRLWDAATLWLLNHIYKSSNLNMQFTICIITIPTNKCTVRINHEYILILYMHVCALSGKSWITGENLYTERTYKLPTVRTTELCKSNKDHCSYRMSDEWLMNKFICLHKTIVWGANLIQLHIQ